MVHTRSKFRAVAVTAAALSVAMGAAIAAPGLAGAAARPSAVARTAKVNAAAELRLARQLLSHIKIGFHPGAMVRGSIVAGVTQLQSTNWSGYADVGTAKGFTKVSASWTQPTGKCSGLGESLAAFWVGLDGISSSDPTVEQDGTVVICDLGSIAYYDWWEMYPTNAIQVEKTVAPGNHVTASVSFSGGSYRLSVADKTSTSASFAVTEKCGTTACENMSAEWIAEAPANSSGVLPLVDFGTWHASGAKETYAGTIGGITGPPTTDEITMVNSSKAVKAQPSAVNLKNNGFSVTWKASQ